MLDLDPDTRITAEEALSHEYLRQYSDPSDEPTAEPYDQAFEEKDFEVPVWKSMSEMFTYKRGAAEKCLRRDLSQFSQQLLGISKQNFCHYIQPSYADIIVFYFVRKILSSCFLCHAH